MPFAVLIQLLPWIIGFSLLFLFILWLFLSLFFTFSYVYTLNTIYICWAIGILTLLSIYGLLLYMNGWRSTFKNFWASLGIIGLIWLFMSACLFYFSWLSLAFTPSQQTTVQVLHQYYSGGRNGCILWKVRLKTGEELRPFCTQHSISIHPEATFAPVTIKRNWLVTEVNYSAAS